MKTTLTLRKLSIIIILSCVSIVFCEATEFKQYSNNWAATDGLGRKLPETEKVGLPKSDKIIGLFYWTWHTDGIAAFSPLMNITEILNAHPEAATDLNHPAWQNPPEGGVFWWDEPLFGYYRTTDEWVRKHAEMLADAGVDVVFFDCTNGIVLTFDPQPAGDYVWTLTNGTEIVGIWEWTDSTQPVTSYYNGSPVEGGYDCAISYNPQLNFTVLTSGINHVPVQITRAIDQQSIDILKGFFTFRPGQADVVYVPTRDDHWGWLEVFPQHGYIPKPEGGFEQTTVGVAQNASDASGGHACGFNNPLTYGRSYAKSAGQNNDPNAYLLGLNFQEQWNRSFELDPDLIFVTGWNEWVAGRWFSWDVKPFAFVDQYSAEKQGYRTC